MSIETPPDVDIDLMRPGSLPQVLTGLEKRKVNLATVAASPINREGITEGLCALRASGISPLLLLRQSDPTWSVDQVLSFLEFLRDWDQLLLRNVLEVVHGRAHEKYLPALQVEAKIELKWFQEWQTAVADPRIHRYPGLPWRSFLRKVNAENFEFAFVLLSEEAGPELDAKVEEFLKGKKKTICVFPKNWSKK